MMTGDEYRDAIEKLNLSQVGAADFLGVDDTTSRRWIADKHPMPRATELLLRAMVHYKLTPSRVAKLIPKE
jgi:hypothetical protein